MIAPSGFPYAELVQPLKAYDEEIILYIPFDNPPKQGTIEFNGTASQLREYSDGCGQKTIRKDCCPVFDPCKWELIYYKDWDNYGNQPHLYRFTNLIRGLHADNACSLVGNTYLRRDHNKGDGVLLNNINSVTFCEVNDMLSNVCYKTRSCLSAGKGISFDPTTGEISFGFKLGTGLIEYQDENGDWVLDSRSDDQWQEANWDFNNATNKGTMIIDGNYHDLPDGLGYLNLHLDKPSNVRLDFDIDTVLTADRVNIGYNNESGVIWNTTVRWRVIDKNFPSLNFNFIKNTSNEITRASWVDSVSTHLNTVKAMAAGDHSLWLQYRATANPSDAPTLRLSTYEVNVLAHWNR